MCVRRLETWTVDFTKYFHQLRSFRMQSSSRISNRDSTWRADLARAAEEAVRAEGRALRVRQVILENLHDRGLLKVLGPAARIAVVQAVADVWIRPGAEKQAN